MVSFDDRGLAATPANDKVNEIASGIREREASVEQAQPSTEELVRPDMGRAQLLAKMAAEQAVEQSLSNVGGRVESTNVGAVQDNTYSSENLQLGLGPGGDVSIDFVGRDSIKSFGEAGKLGTALGKNLRVDKRGLSPAELSKAKDELYDIGFLKKTKQLLEADPNGAPQKFVDAVNSNLEQSYKNLEKILGL